MTAYTGAIASTPQSRRLWTLVALMLAGEAIFMLPFAVPRFFRPILLDVTGMSNTELGAAQGVYGLVAMVAYFVGGPLADRFAARTLMALSLGATAIAGLALAAFPGPVGAAWLWGLFAVTTVLLFCAALIKATRAWGATDGQGAAFGWLDSGRGLVAAVLATGGTLLLSAAFPEDAAPTVAQRATTLRHIVLLYVAFTAATAGLLWWVLPARDGAEEERQLRAPLFASSREALRNPGVWSQALIVLCAYVGYKGFDQYGLYAVDVYGLSDVQAAQLSTLGAWMRVVAAVAAGVIGDRIGLTRATVGAFTLLLLSHLSLAAIPGPGGAAWLWIQTVATCAAIFALRGLYFALFEAANVRFGATGGAVAVVSLLGYTPDVFVGYVAGRLIDGSPGPAGYQALFLFLAAFSAIGLAVSLRLHRTPTRAGRWADSLGEANPSGRNSP